MTDKSPIEQMQEVLGKLDPSAMLIGFATVAEWLEEDGQHSMSIMHTSMAPWHLHGLMTFARDNHCSEFAYTLSPDDLVEDDYEDDEDY